MILSAPHAWSAQDAQELVVLTYNIHHAQGTDGQLDLPRIAKIIIDSKAQLVALQEVDVETERVGKTNIAAELGRLTGMRHAFGAAMDYQGGKYGQAILSTFPMSDVTSHQLPQREKREPRIAVEATIQIGGTMQNLVFATTHLDHQLEEVRLEQAAKVNELFAAENKLAILAGDFNARPESKTMKVMFEKWSDASAASPAPTIPAENPKHRIDYILLRPGNRWETMETKVLNEPIASDHRPVLVRLKLIPEKKSRP
ncbi:MAG: endonuclease/exonuclease/phosphatase family protein [Verrucomicrobiales bacterium]